MALDLWFREDVARILASTQETMSGLLGEVSTISSAEADAYHRGFVDALRAVGIAFGVARPGAAPGSGCPTRPGVPEVLPAAGQSVPMDPMDWRP
ncbi:hypothetical protein ACFLYD_03785 [Chloroflexota bacterium]